MMALTMLTSSVLGQAQTNSEDEKALQKIPVTIEAGWNNKSGETFASVFAETHDYIVVNGFYFPNFTRKQNAFVHQGLFDGIYKNNTLQLKIDKISFLRPDLAMITVLGASYAQGTSKPTDPTAIMTILAEKKNADWKIISFHNHSLAESFAIPTPPVPHKVMYASWYKN